MCSSDLLILIGILKGAFIFVADLARAIQRPVRMDFMGISSYGKGTTSSGEVRVTKDLDASIEGANVIIVNRPGAGGAIGYKYVASQKPDGYALVWNSNSISTTFHSGQSTVDYRAFEPVARVLAESPVLAVKGDAKWKTLNDFIADAKAQPGKITVANSGTGSHTHISAAALFKTSGVEIIDVPYGAAQVVPSLLGGHVDAMLQLPGALAGHVKGGSKIGRAHV